MSGLCCQIVGCCVLSLAVAAISTRRKEGAFVYDGSFLFMYKMIKMFYFYDIFIIMLLEIKYLKEDKMRQMYGKLAICLLFCVGVAVSSVQAQIPQRMLGRDSEDDKGLLVVTHPKATVVADENADNSEPNADIDADIAAENTPDISTLQNTDSTPQGNIIVTPDVNQLPEKTLEQPEIEVKLDVFEPEFMGSLIACRADKAVRGRMVLEIVGEKDNNCYLKYGHYELNVPKTLLNNVHGFDDMEILVKNKDVARYKYLPKYMYDGLIYALNNCAGKQDYFGLEENEKLSDASVTRSLNAEYKDNTCIIYLRNNLWLDFESASEDYGYTCRLPQEAIDELLPYFKDIIAKHNEENIPLDERPKEVRDADIALMYYLQQNDYCTKNNGQQAEGEN